MIFYYAAGGGLGHLTRARAVVHTLGLKEPVVVLTASPFAADLRVVGDLEVISIPRAFEFNLPDYRDWLRALLAERQPAEIFLDAFPAGLVGEFCDFTFPEGVKLRHLARLLRWDEYGKQLRGAAPVFDVTYVLEPLAAPHEVFLREHSKELEHLTLEDPPHDLTDELKESAVRIMRPSVEEYTLSNRRQAIHKPIWIIVHAGPAKEVAELVAYAEELRRAEQVNPRLILLSPENPDLIRTAILRGLPTADSSLPTSFEQFDFYPAAAFFHIADRLITACGFNTVRQTTKFREKHRFLPFPRRFDDQFHRAALAKSITNYPK